jgi:hypothetical protein
MKPGVGRGDLFLNPSSSSGPYGGKRPGRSPSSPPPHCAPTKPEPVNTWEALFIDAVFRIPYTPHRNKKCGGAGRFALPQPRSCEKIVDTEENFEYRTRNRRMMKYSLRFTNHVSRVTVSFDIQYSIFDLPQGSFFISPPPTRGGKVLGTTGSPCYRERK